MVQAYKNSIPAIIIGWADKYYELMSEFNQLEYYFDIRKSLDAEKLLINLKLMISNYKKEKVRIRQRIDQIKKLKSPFDIFS